MIKCPECKSDSLTYHPDCIDVRFTDTFSQSENGNWVFDKPVLKLTELIECESNPLFSCKKCTAEFNLKQAA